ncbi:hypothetical protein PR048_003018 [Dryococelus australis]|uniref:Uncharacterized protein n=1 Tax=Dryococelus australis TaxID=614101 RepID=A0ABQ9IP32_9NEOP|nr:hypothetical protein PR048_003018 [Dryococelus australis]
MHTACTHAPSVPRVNAATTRIKAVHDEVSILKINLRKKSLPLPACTSTRALRDMRPAKLESSMPTRKAAGELKFCGYKNCGRYKIFCQCANANSWSDEALGVRVSVARIAPSLLDLGFEVPTGGNKTRIAVLALRHTLRESAAAVSSSEPYHDMTSRQILAVYSGEEEKLDRRRVIAHRYRGAVNHGVVETVRGSMSDARESRSCSRTTSLTHAPSYQKFATQTAPKVRIAIGYIPVGPDSRTRLPLPELPVRSPSSFLLRDHSLTKRPGNRQTISSRSDPSHVPAEQSALHLPCSGPIPAFAWNYFGKPLKTEVRIEPRSSRMRVHCATPLGRNPLRSNVFQGGAGMKGRGRREIPEKTRRPTASSGTILTCDNPVTQPGIKPGEVGGSVADGDVLPTGLELRHDGSGSGGNPDASGLAKR